MCRCVCVCMCVYVCVCVCLLKFPSFLFVCLLSIPRPPFEKCSFRTPSLFCSPNTCCCTCKQYCDNGVCRTCAERVQLGSRAARLPGGSTRQLRRGRSQPGVLRRQWMGSFLELVPQHTAGGVCGSPAWYVTCLLNDNGNNGHFVKCLPHSSKRWTNAI